MSICEFMVRSKLRQIASQMHDLVRFEIVLGFGQVFDVLYLVNLFKNVE